MKIRSIDQSRSRRSFLQSVVGMGTGVAAWMATGAVVNDAQATDGASKRTLPRVPGILKLHARRRAL